MTEAATRKQKVRYKYDALGRRVRRYTPGVREDTKFTNDGLDVLIDDDAGTLTKYINGPGIDNKLRVQNGSNVNYFLTDHLGSANGLADGSGNLTSTAAYDSFGSATGNLATRYQFTGREFDSFSGLQFSRARFYDQKLGRFASEDPIGFNGGDVNLYGYVKNNAFNFRDPSGKSPAVVVAAVVGGAIAAEILLHYALANYADNNRSFGADPYGRRRHCWVNCMSTRLHLGNPLPVAAGGLFKEVVNYYQDPSLLNDSIKDLDANRRGQQLAYVFWKGCEQLCNDCQADR